jgi:hypothetical protein
VTSLGLVDAVLAPHEVRRKLGVVASASAGAIAASVVAGRVPFGAVLVP